MSNIPLSLREHRVEEATSMRCCAQGKLREASERSRSLSRSPFTHCVGFKLHGQELTQSTVEAAYQQLVALYAKDEIKAAAEYVYWFQREQDLIEELKKAKG